MEWPLALLIILGGLLLLMMTGLPIAFCFILINLVGVFLFAGGEAGLGLFILSILRSVTTFALVPVALFILMGELMFQSEMGFRMLNVLDKWMGRLPGRLGLLAVGGGTLFSVMSGSSIASVALLGTVLVPEMEKHGYKKSMSIGPVMGSGGLAMIIPPSAMAVLLGALGEINVGKLLIGGVIPGLIIAVFYASYIIIRCWLQPSIAPRYEITPTPLSEKILAFLQYVLPLGLIVFMVLGLIFLGITTPSEAAATGSIGAFILAAAYRSLNWQVIKKSFTGTIEITVMLLMIITGATAFGQILSLSGASRGLVDLATSLPLSPIMLVIVMQLVILILGTFLSLVPIMMITLPIFIPIVSTLGFDPIWFGIIMLINLEMAGTTPPFGLLLYVMRGVAPPGTTMGDVVRAGLPFLLCDLAAIILCFVFPVLVLWLPGIML